ncbi:flagellar assembly protein FliW [Peribacillus glennii]|uniref:Flagellar assembly factor FliW n=1 Tax=Peribacillus glennii TaxID=2303991 RepID=A0A372LD97_9BACI|nr:flagellar assembly protein FliW [Peribacillus glennii]RFU63947.1 flagellar assembly protein FliW [Peribacillus glennii]
MKIQSIYHGEIEIEETQIISFDRGLPGFLDQKKFAIIPLADDDTLMTLQSIQNAQLAFVIANPFSFFTDYDFTIDEATIEQLKLDSPDQVQVYSILTVQEPFDKTTANLQAPIIINKSSNIGKQVILNQTPYTTKHKIFHQTKKASKG